MVGGIRQNTHTHTHKRVFLDMVGGVRKGELARNGPLRVSCSKGAGKLRLRVYISLCDDVARVRRRRLFVRGDGRRRRSSGPSDCSRRNEVPRPQGKGRRSNGCDSGSASLRGKWRRSGGSGGRRRRRRRGPRGGWRRGRRRGGGGRSRDKKRWPG